MHLAKWNYNYPMHNNQSSSVKFVIWGFGIRGKSVLKGLGNQHIAAIIDINMQPGTKYGSIPIISLEIYKREYMEYPIIVTPKGEERKIIQTLHEEKIYHGISYGEDYTRMESFSYIFHKEEISKKLRHSRHIIIYGYCGLGLLLFEYLSVLGLHVSLAVDRKNMRLSHEQIDNDEIDNIILVKNTPEEEVQKLLQLNKEITDFSNFADFFPLFHRENLEKFKDIHKGKRCFIVAPGPSLKINDLGILHEKHEICFSLNKVILALNQTLWRPDYFVLSDMYRAEELKNDLLRYSEIEYFISDNAWPFIENDIDGIHKYHINTIWDDENERPSFSEDFSSMVYAGRTVTYVALQLAVYMGFKEIYLLGVDCSYMQEGQNNYFVKTKEEKNVVFRTDMMQRAYESAKIYADEHDIHIYNATRGGRLEVFERVDFDTLF